VAARWAATAFPSGLLKNRYGRILTGTPVWRDCTMNNKYVITAGLVATAFAVVAGCGRATESSSRRTGKHGDEAPIADEGRDTDQMMQDAADGSLYFAPFKDGNGKVIANTAGLTGALFTQAIVCVHNDWLAAELRKPKVDASAVDAATKFGATSLGFLKNAAGQWRAALNPLVSGDKSHRKMGALLIRTADIAQPFDKRCKVAATDRITLHVSLVGGVGRPIVQYEPTKPLVMILSEKTQPPWARGQAVPLGLDSVLHEMGHAFGLGDTYVEPATVPVTCLKRPGKAAQPGSVMCRDVIRLTLTADDRMGVMCMGCTAGYWEGPMGLPPVCQALLGLNAVGAPVAVNTCALNGP
jgi:hypothetical protein